MACLKFVLKDISRYQLQYPLTRSDDNLFLFSNEPLEAAVTSVEMNNASSATYTFSRPFSGTPNVVVGFISLSSGSPSVNLYAETATETGGVIRTSAPVTGKVAIHAVYLPAAPLILTPPEISVLP